MGKLEISKSKNLLPVQTYKHVLPAHRRVVLSKEESEQLLKATMFSSMIDELKIDNQINAIEYQKEVNTFFKQCSKNDSKHTVRQYTRLCACGENGLSRLENYTKENDINILKLNSRESDDFCIELKDTELSNASIRSVISSCSAFFSFLHVCVLKVERRHIAIKNPFRGTRTRPPIRAKKQVLIPTSEELNIIIESISNPVIKMAIIFIRDTGIRVGALDTLKIKANKYYAYSKGKDISGAVSDDLIKQIIEVGLDALEPFKNKNSEVVRVTFATICKRLHARKIINASYSVHDIRHLFAALCVPLASFYKQTKDIYALKNLLNHSSIAITEVYLKSLDI